MNVRRGGAVLLLIALGLANTLALYGRDPLRPTNLDWMTGDPATHYTAWAIYRDDTRLHFPLTWTDRLGYPVGSPIAWQEPIPLLAVALRPFNAILPVPFQYLGWWAALSFVLQAYFGFRISELLLGSSGPFSILGGVLFLISAPLTWRAFGHIPFLSQWLILALLAAYLRDPDDRPIRWLARQWIILALSAALASYISVMCCLVVLAGVARLRVEQRCGRARTMALALATVGILFATAATFGVLASTHTSSYWAPGYGRFSMNLDAPFNPLFPGSLLPPLPLAFEQQYEGYNYLGAGLIGLLVLGVVRSPRSIARLTERRWLPLVGLFVACTAIAVSTTVTLGSVTLFEVALPSRLVPIVESLRASGRFFWPAYYLLVAAALAMTFSAWKPVARVVVLAVAIGVQFVDLMPLRARVHADLERRFPDPLVSSAWRGLGRRYDTLILVPAYQCDPRASPGDVDSYVTFGKFAAAERMRTNSYYSGRYSREQLEAHCVDLLRTALLGPLDPRSAYVVTDAVRAVWQLDGVDSHRCRLVDGYDLCTTDTSEPAPPLPSAHVYELGERVGFLTGGSGGPYATFGWGVPTPDGTWTEGPLSLIRLGLKAPLDSTRSFVLETEVIPLVTAAHPTIVADVFVNGERVDTWTFGMPGGILTRRARIPGPVTARRPELDVEFRIRNPEAPLYLGLGPVTLYEGLCLRRLAVISE